MNTPEDSEMWFARRNLVLNVTSVASSTGEIAEKYYDKDMKMSYVWMKRNLEKYVAGRESIFWHEITCFLPRRRICMYVCMYVYV